MKTKKLVMCAMLSAITCVATMIIRIPISARGYVNLGDCAVLLCGFLLGPLSAALSAGIGSSLADVFSGYIIYAVPTFVIKGLMAYVASVSIKRFGDKKLWYLFLYTFLCELIMILGYFLFETLLYGPAAAVTSVIGNAMQGLFALVSAPLFYKFKDITKITIDKQ